MNNVNETFIGFAGLLGVSALICFPFLGWTGICAAVTAIYFCLALTNGADTASKRRRRK
jgi:hypothetical protein